MSALALSVGIIRLSPRRITLSGCGIQSNGRVPDLDWRGIWCQFGCLVRTKATLAILAGGTDGKIILRTKFKPSDQSSRFGYVEGTLIITRAGPSARSEDGALSRPILVQADSMRDTVLCGCSHTEEGRSRWSLSRIGQTSEIEACSASSTPPKVPSQHPHESVFQRLRR